MSILESSVFHSGLWTGGYSIFQGVGGHGFRCTTNGFSIQEYWREFVEEVSVAGLLAKLDAGAPYNGWIFGGGLRLYLKKIAEKVPMGFNSKESFTKVDENSNVAD
jgi:hypothetical protein